MKALTLTRNTMIDDRSNAPAVTFAAAALRRDLDARLGFADSAPAATAITLLIEPNAKAFDAHSIHVASDGIAISGSAELGLIHGAPVLEYQRSELVHCILAGEDQ